MKPSMLVVVVAICVSFILPTGVADATKTNFKKDYCEQQEYLGNDGGKYPHLHCKKDAFSFAASEKQHYNLHEGNGPTGAGCKRANAIATDPEGYGVDKKHMVYPQDVKDAINKFIKAECS
jgi:hypothetical protein